MASPPFDIFVVECHFPPRGYAAAHGGKPPAYRHLTLLNSRLRRRGRGVASTLFKSHCRKGRAFPLCAAAEPRELSDNSFYPPDHGPSLPDHDPSTADHDSLLPDRITLLADRDPAWQNRVIKNGNPDFIRLSAGLPGLMRFQH